MTESQISELDTAAEIWWASNPALKPLDQYTGGSVLFRTAAPEHMFYGKIEGANVIMFLDTEVGMEHAWKGPVPIEFVEVPKEVAAIYMML